MFRERTDGFVIRFAHDFEGGFFFLPRVRIAKEIRLPCLPCLLACFFVSSLACVFISIVCMCVRTPRCRCETNESNTCIHMRCICSC